MVTPGMCPPHLQHLRGKDIPIGTLLHPPMIILDKETKEITGGAQVEILHIYARKFDFTPILETVTGGFDNEGGLVPSVRIISLKFRITNDNSADIIEPGSQ